MELSRGQVAYRGESILPYIVRTAPIAVADGYNNVVCGRGDAHDGTVVLRMNL